jgi:hypothetical protein
MSVVGIDFGSLHSKACYPSLTPLLPLADALRVNLDRCCKAQRHRYHYERSLESCNTVSFSLLLFSGLINRLFTGRLFHSVPSSARLASRQKHRRSQIFVTLSAR